MMTLHVWQIVSDGLYLIRVPLSVRAHVVSGGKRPQASNPHASRAKRYQQMNPQLMKDDGNDSVSSAKYTNFLRVDDEVQQRQYLYETTSIQCTGSQ